MNQLQGAKPETRNSEPMNTAHHRWRTVVDFVRANDVSDVCLYAGSVTARLEGRIVRLSEEGALSTADVMEMIGELLASQRAIATEIGNAMGAVDFTTELFAKRFRVNIARARGELFASMRPLPEQPPESGQVGLSAQLVRLVARLNSGLILVTGPTGSGKSTTIAALIQAINRVKQAKIITIEDPIEFLFQPDQSEVIQREIGSDTVSYEQGLREALRQNPDVIVVGEIRDSETAIVALQAAETGHLVFGSLHASSVVESIGRYLLLGSIERAAEMRYVLSKVFRVITNQRLLRKRGGGRIAVREVCVHAANLEAVIQRGSDQELNNYMLAGREAGMIDFQTALKSVQSIVDPADFQLFGK
jgi:twitching motility protein PilT